MSRLVKDCDILDGQMLGNLKQMLTDGLCGQPSGKKVSREQMELMEAACRKCCTVPKIQALEAESAVLSLKNHSKNSLGHTSLLLARNFWFFRDSTALFLFFRDSQHFFWFFRDSTALFWTVQHFFWFFRDSAALYWFFRDSTALLSISMQKVLYCP